MRVGDMDARTLNALAEEIEREAHAIKPPDRGPWQHELTRLKQRLTRQARLYRMRARRASGGWAVVDALKGAIDG